MKIIIALTLLISASSFAGPVQEENKNLVVAFYEMAFNQHQPTAAAKKYIGGKYIQHNPNVPNGAAAFTRFFESFFTSHPQSSVKIYRALADGDLVALHLHSKLNNADRGRAI